MFIFLASFHAYYLVKGTLRFDDALLRRGRLGRARLRLASLRNVKIPRRRRQKYKLRMRIEIFRVEWWRRRDNCCREGVFKNQYGGKRHTLKEVR